MAATVSTPPTPDPPASPFPTQKPTVRPNPHPYAIKTTSGGALARSNSSSAAVPTRHHYVPSSPAPRSPERPSSRSEYRGHRFSTSISSTGDHQPRAPSSPTRSERSLSLSEHEFAPPPRRPKRTELPTLHTATRSEVAAFEKQQEEELPGNPKTWTPAQLSSYLVRVLRARGAGVAPPVARDIASWVRAQSITGRAFLRWTEEDLEEIGVNTLWRKALLDAARNLRQNVLRGRIWGSPELPPSPGGTLASSPTGDAEPFGELYSSASSTDSLNLSAGARIKRRNAGRVKGLVTRWETHSRSGSEAGSENESESELHFAGSTFRGGRFVGSNSSPEAGPAAWPSSADADEEPSIEELLAAGADADAAGQWGARAWEAPSTGGETMRRATSDDAPPPPYGTDTSSAPTEKKEAAGKEDEGWDYRAVGTGGFGSGFMGSVRRVRGSRGTRAGGTKERRAVTSMFAQEEEQAAPAPISEEPAPSAAQPAFTDDGDFILPAPVDTPATHAHERAPSSTPGEEADALASLEAEMASTRELLAALHARLAVVERRVAAMDAAEAEKEAESGKEVVRKEPGRGDVVVPYAIGDLPGYVVLVGLGVCAVVLRVVMQRVALGRRA